MSTSTPTYEQVMQLPAQIELDVPADFIDVNGHMNIGHYLQQGAEGLWYRCRDDLDMGVEHFEQRQMSNFTAEHHLRYLAEILEGEQLSVHVRLIARSDKTLHAVALILNRTRQQLACIMEATLIHIDLTSRTSVAFPADIASRIDTALAADELSWPAPLSGPMGVRRTA